jgi:adenylate cyclase
MSAREATLRQARRGGPRLNEALERHRTLPGIAFLPFVAVDAYVGPDFVDRMTYCLTDGLQGHRDLRVTAAASTLRYRNTAKSVRQIGSELGVRYLVKGQILRADQGLTIVQRLYDTASGEPIGPPYRVERNIDALIELRARIVDYVVASLVPAVRRAETGRALRQTHVDLTAYQLVLKALVHMHRLNAASLATASRQLLRAQRLDPGYAPAFAWAARVHSLRIGQGLARNPREEAMKAMKPALHAIQLDSGNAVALATVGHLHSYLLRDFETGLAYLERAVEACPNEPLAPLLMGATLAYVGRPVEGLQFAEHAMSLSPFDPWAYAMHNIAGLCCYAARRYEEAEHHAREAFKGSRRYSTIYKLLIVALVAQGRVAEAREWAAELRRIEPNLARTALGNFPFDDVALREEYAAQLRTAGILDPPLDKRW